MDDYLGIGLGFQRLLFFGMIFILASHIVSCFWLILAELVGTIEKQYEETWLGNFYTTYKDSDISLYYVSFYWTITTITTVGYGDISGTNNYERLFASFVMVVGVILFSIANGALASIISSLDGQSGEYEDKLNTLILAHKEFQFPTRLYIQLQKSILYVADNQNGMLDNFMDSLPS